MFCTNCGREITNPNDKFCPGCGSPVNGGAPNSQAGGPANSYNRGPAAAPVHNNYGNGQNYAYTNSDDSGSIGWGVLGFFIPLVGLILYIVWKNDKPNNAKSAGMGALISVIISVVLYVIVFAVAGTASVINA